VPDNGGKPDGFSGGAAIGIPAVDAAKGLIYFATNHQYTQPKAVTDCLTAEPNDWKAACYPSDARFSSVIALDLETGRPKWSTFGAGPDVYQSVCGTLPVSWKPFATDYAGGGPGRVCPPASDFLSWSFATGSPHLFTIDAGGQRRDVVGIGQKSGVYWVFDAMTGAVVWHSLVGPYSEPGGVTWGAAYDGRIYVTLTNADHTPYRLASGKITDGGFWTALDPVTGKIIWQTPEPQGAPVYAAPVAANGVVYAASLASTGSQMFALDPATGSILWQFGAGGSVGGHPAIADGAVFWGSGFNAFPNTARNDKVYGFSVDGK
jgi:polyvinyl alcohol dehydrogenase (cytochrome)